MDKAKKEALKTGVDERNERLEYRCPNCGALIPLAMKRCSNCRKRRPKDAYERALSYKAEVALERTPIKKTPQPGTACKIPLPRPLCYAGPDAPANCSIVPPPIPSTCYSNQDMYKLKIPKFYSTDEYGRVFEMPISYKPLGMGGPVPVPIPAQTVQTSPIDIPLNFKA